MADWVTGVIAGVSGIAGGAATQWFTLIKESRVSKKARFRDMQFIGVELLLKLTELSEHCRKLSNNYGEAYFDSRNGQEETVPSVPVRGFTLEGIQGKWDALPAELLFRIRELPLTLASIERFMGDVAKYDESHYFNRRMDIYGKQAVRIEALTEQLRVRCQLPENQDIHE